MYHTRDWTDSMRYSSTTPMEYTNLILEEHVRTVPTGKKQKLSASKWATNTKASKLGKHDPKYYNGVKHNQTYAHCPLWQHTVFEHNPMYVLTTGT